MLPLVIITALAFASKACHLGELGTMDATKGETGALDNVADPMIKTNPPFL